jgi:hypothetical protein
MKYFLDFEFIEDGKTIDPISVGIVAEDGREYYAVFREFDRVAFFKSPWLVKNVAPSLPLTKLDDRLPMSYANYDELYTNKNWKHRDEIRLDILEFVNPSEYGKPEFWGYYADYDWVTLCQLYGKMIDLPYGWPMYCNDLKQLAVSLGNPKFPKPEGEHNALNDARWNMSVYQQLMDRKLPPIVKIALPPIRVSTLPERMNAILERLDISTDTIQSTDFWQTHFFTALEGILDRLDYLEDLIEE